LWLREPDGAALAHARQSLGLEPPASSPEELAQAYTDLLLLNVYPYASIYLDPNGELGGQRAAKVEALFEETGYAPPALRDVAAPDHIGLMLGYLEAAGPANILPLLLDWAPAFCLAVEREPGAHRFYRSLAAFTRATLLHSSIPPLFDPSTPPSIPLTSAPDDDLTLHTLVRHLLTPARSGLFLSRGRLGHLGRELGLRLPFGERFAVGLALFQAAGAAGAVPGLIDRLSGEVEAWDSAFGVWAEQYPAWAAYAAESRGRLAGTRRLLSEIRLTAVEGIAFE
jgi:TorA maturation chaperone TorD